MPENEARRHDTPARKRGFAASCREQGVNALVAAPVGVLAGISSAFFLWSLDRMTATRLAHPWLLFLLPVAGMLTAWIYARFGKDSHAGNNLILENIHRPGGGVPARMAPLVLAGTLATHLCGGSAGREGTAVQMGGSLAAAFGKYAKLPAASLRVALIAGVAGGFGAVFGTPFAGAVFAIEVLETGRLRHRALIPALVGAFVGDRVCAGLGAHHTAYHIALSPGAESPALFLKILIAAVAFGLAGRLFAEATHAAGDTLKRLVPSGVWRAALGGALVIGLACAAGTRDYLGLGVSSPDPRGVSILAAFTPEGAHTWSWAWKLLFTAVTLGAGFKGGEVTPLFFIGATLGNTLALATGAPVDLFAGLGFIAVFAGAANTPLACAIMGVELFGGSYAPHFLVACYVAYRVSGHGGIYHAQRVGEAKHPRARGVVGLTLGDLRHGGKR